MVTTDARVVILQAPRCFRLSRTGAELDGADLSDRCVYAIAYKMCRFVVRAVRVEYTNNYTKLNDAVVALAEYCTRQGMPHVAASVRGAWRCLESVITRIPLCSYWDAHCMAMHAMSHVPTVAHGLQVVVCNPVVTAMACSKRSHTYDAFRKTRGELRRIGRRLAFLTSCGQTALGALSRPN